MKIRASQVGKLMASPRSKGEVLSQTAKTYIQELVLEHKYGIRKEINSRYLTKGIDVENESIALFEKVHGFDFLYKNEDYFENDYVCGTPDIITNSHVIDVKSSWTGSTFPFFDTEIPNKDYYYQLQAYMWLTDRKDSILAYCLIDTPEDLVLDEIRKASWNKKEIQISEQTEYEVRKQHSFGHIPEATRVRSFLIEYDQEAIDLMKQKIGEAETYYNELMAVI